MVTVYIGLGSNIGDREKNISKAIDLLGDDRNIEIKKRSSVYNTKPVGGPPQRDFYNCVVETETNTGPVELLERIKAIEKEFGRAKTPRNFPRIIDLDILMYGGSIIENENLNIPHPRMHERTFVLKGFNEIAPDIIHPIMGKTIAELYRDIVGDADLRPLQK